MNGRAGEGTRILRDVATWLHLSPVQVGRLYSGNLQIAGLLPEALAILAQLPQAAWGTDRLMRARILSTLVEEFPVSLGTSGLALAGAFVDDDAFWPVLHGGLSLTEEFGAFIKPTAGDLAVLEAEIAAARRRFAFGPHPAHTLGEIRVSPGVGALVVENGAFAAWTAAWSQASSLPARVAEGERLASCTWSGESTALLIQMIGTPPAADVSESTAEIVQLFIWLQEGKSVEAVVTRLENFGVSAAEAAELFAEWRADGLIIG